MKVSFVTGAVLAGGRSRRMGADKALLTVGRKRLVEHVYDVMKEAFDCVLVVTKEPGAFRLMGLPVVRDAVDGSGAIIGIYTALLACDTLFAFVVGCDMPFIKPELLRWMASRCGEYDAFVPRIGQFIEPLFAVYSKACIAPMARQIARGDFRVRGFFEEVKTGYAAETDVRAVDPDLSSFININDRGDFERMVPASLNAVGELSG